MAGFGWTGHSRDAGLRQQRAILADSELSDFGEAVPKLPWLLPLAESHALKVVAYILNPTGFVGQSRQYGDGAMRRSR